MKRAAQRATFHTTLNPLREWTCPILIEDERGSTCVRAERRGAQVRLDHMSRPTGEPVSLIYNVITGEAHLEVGQQTVAMSQVAEFRTRHVRTCFRRRWHLPSLEPQTFDEFMSSDPRWSLSFRSQDGQRIGYATYRGIRRVSVLWKTQDALVESLWHSIVASHLYGAGGHG